MNRRAALSLIASSLAFRGTAPAPASDSAPRVIDKNDFEVTRKVLAKAGISSEQKLQTPHYLIVADQLAGHQAKVGRFCEALLANATTVFADAKLPLDPINRLMTMVILDTREYERLARVAGRGPGTGGFYNTGHHSCYILVQDDRRSGRIDWDKTVTNLGHEAIHQISQMSGLVTESDGTPSCIYEGIATLGEVSSMDSPRLLRQSSDRFAALVNTREVPPPSLTDLLTDDRHFSSRHTENKHRDYTYAYAWLLVHTLLTDRDLHADFRDYLKTVASRKDDKHRIGDIEKHFGAVETLEKRLAWQTAKLKERPLSRYSSVRRAANPK